MVLCFIDAVVLNVSPPQPTHTPLSPPHLSITTRYSEHASAAGMSMPKAKLRYAKICKASPTYGARLVAAKYVVSDNINDSSTSIFCQLEDTDRER